jgi:hypothetical protein
MSLHHSAVRTVCGFAAIEILPWKYSNKEGSLNKIHQGKGQ